jgi:MFS family permease
MDVVKIVEVEGARDSLFTRGFVLLLVAQSSFGMSFSAMFLLPKYLKLALHASDAEVGVTQALGAFAGVFAFPVVGVLNDRYGRRIFVILGTILMTLSALALGQVHTVGLLLCGLRMLQGLAFAMLFNSASTLVADGVPKAQLGRGLAVFGASMLATNALSPAIAEPLAQRYGWPSLFTLSIAWGMLSVVLSLFVPEARASSPVREQPRAGALSLLAARGARRVVLLMVAAGAGFGAVFTFHQPYALRLGIARVSGFFVSYAVFALVVRLAFMARLDRMDRQRASALSLFVYGLAIAATAFIRPGVLELVGGLMGLAQGVFYPVFNALAIESVPTRQRGSMMALYHGGFNAGLALASLVGGAFAERFGYMALFFLCGGLTAVASLVLFNTASFAVPEAQATLAPLRE